MLQQAQEYQRLGKFTLAYQAYLKCSQLRPDHAMLSAVAGNMAGRSGRLEEAVRLLERAAQLEPANDDIQHDLCRAYRMVGRFDDAHRAIDTSLRLRPDKINRVATKSELYQMTNDLERAWSTLVPVLSSASTSAVVATQYLRLAAKQDRHDDAIRAARACIATTSPNQFSRLNLLFGIASLLDQLKRYEEAFHAYEAANNAAGIAWDPSIHSGLVDAAVTAWTREAVATLPVGDPATTRPIFIVGMPRSGTTLVEQMLSSLPGVFGAGELNDISILARQLEPRTVPSMPFLTSPDPLRRANVPDLAQQYLARLASWSPDAVHVTDKLPNNALNVGLIRTLFPRAAIINCRRNPLDICVSCFTQHFDGYIPFAYNLEHCGRFLRDLDRIMDLWDRVYPGAVHHIEYEDLVNDPEPHARAILDFVGIPWDDRCLRFHENTRVARTASIDQVRQQIYTSAIGKYRRFDPWLGSLKEILGDGGREA